MFGVPPWVATMLGIQGADEVVTWFGQWPSFHDAEILSFHLNRAQTSSIRLRVWTTSKKLDAEGRFVRERETILVIDVRRIHRLELQGEDVDVQNVIAGLTIEQVDDGYRVEIDPSYGLAGSLVAAEIAVRLER